MSMMFIEVSTHVDIERWHRDDAEASRTVSIRIKADRLSKKMVLLLKGISRVKSIKGGKAKTGALGTLIIPLEGAELNNQSSAF